MGLTVKERLMLRREKCVCKMCGSRLDIRMVIYNQYGGQGLDLYCPHCKRVEYGVEPEVYEAARAFVEKFEFNYFTDMSENERNFELNISKVCDIAAWILKYRGELDEEGLLISPKPPAQKTE